MKPSRGPQVLVLIWLWLKNPVPKMGCPGKWKHGPKPAVCRPCFILSHTHIHLPQAMGRFSTHPSGPTEMDRGSLHVVDLLDFGISSRSKWTEMGMRYASKWGNRGTPRSGLTYASKVGEPQQMVACLLTSLSSKMKTTSSNTPEEYKWDAMDRMWIPSVWSIHPIALPLVPPCEKPDHYTMVI